MLTKLLREVRRNALMLVVEMKQPSYFLTCLLFYTIEIVAFEKVSNKSLSCLSVEFREMLFPHRTTTPHQSFTRLWIILFVQGGYGGLIKFKVMKAYHYVKTKCCCA